MTHTFYRYILGLALDQGKSNSKLVIRRPGHFDGARDADRVLSRHKEKLREAIGHVGSSRR